MMMRARTAVGMMMAGVLIAGGCVQPVAPADDTTTAPPVAPVDPWAPPAAQPVPAAEAPAAVETPPVTEAEPAAVEPRTHVVARGETLYGLSVKYYGTGTRWPQIVEANPGLRPERMPVGKTIVIP